MEKSQIRGKDVGQGEGATLDWSLYPDSLRFTRASGASYYHVGRCASGREWVKSCDTGKVREMNSQQLAQFKRT